MKKFLAVVLLCTAVLAFGQNATTLRYSYELGKSYSYALSTQNTVTMEMNGQEMVTEMGQNAKLLIVPQSVTEQGNFTCWVSFPELSVKVKNFRMDSTVVMSEIINKRAEIVHTPLGKVLNSTMIDSVKFLDPMMAQMNIEPTILFRRLLVNLPENAVAAGGTWTESKVDTVVQGGITISVTPDITFTVIGEEERAGLKCLKIDFKGAMAISGSGTQMGANIAVDGEGTQAGTLYFAPAQGILVTSESSMDQEMTIAVTGPANMTFPQTVSSKSTLTYLP
jgi:hypothetical protein